MESPDGRWRVDAVCHGRQEFYRLTHDDNVIDGLSIGTVERLLTHAGVEMADMVDASATRSDVSQPGVA